MIRRAICLSWVLGLGLLSLEGQGPVRIGIVDYQAIFNQYHKTVHANRVLQAKLASSKARDEELVRQRETCVNQLQRLREASLDPKLSKKDREGLKRAYEQKSKELSEIERKLAEWRTRQNKEIQEYSGKSQLQLMRDVITAVGTEARQRGLDLVVDHQGRVLYVRDPEDLTQAVLGALNVSQPSKPKELGATPPSGEPETKLDPGSTRSTAPEPRALPSP